MVSAPPYSKSKVNKAAKSVRRYLRTPKAERDAEVFDEAVAAFAVLVWWRDEHAGPLAAATRGLRSRCQTEETESAYVGQRLKRMPTILSKLDRYPKMEFARMADVGGCRAVLGCPADVQRVRRNYERSSTYRKTLDYVTDPKDDGYRGIHIIVQHSNRQIEVQLRTRTQHEWAQMVESLGSKLGVSLKTGIGPPEAFEFFEIVSRVQALEELGQAADEKDLASMATLRAFLMSLIASGGEL